MKGWCRWWHPRFPRRDMAERDFSLARGEGDSLWSVYTPSNPVNGDASIVTEFHSPWPMSGFYALSQTNHLVEARPDIVAELVPLWEQWRDSLP